MADIQDAVKPPFAKVYTEITTVCNGNCSFCPGTSRRAEFITVERFSALMDSLRGYTEYVYLHLMGEPLMHPDLGELLHIARSKGFKPCITTNGTLLPERGEALLKDAYKVSISVHSFERGSRDEYLDYIKGCMDFADRASASGVLTVLRLWNRGYDGGRNVDTVALLKERFTDPWVERGDRTRIRHRLHLEMGERFDWPDTEAEDLGSRAYCYGLADHFGVLVDGTVVPCCLDREGVIALGNVYLEPLEEILSSPRALAIKEGFKQRQCTEQLCRRCGYSRRFKV